MFRRLLIPALMAFATPAFAQDNIDHSKMDHGSAYKPDHHAGHDHEAETHEETEVINSLTLANQPNLAAAVAAGGEPIVAKVLGAVCDFCVKAMNKTFGKRDDVAAVYVDLDSKTLNLVLKPGATMTDKELIKAVKKSGYKVDSIARGPNLIDG